MKGVFNLSKKMKDLEYKGKGMFCNYVHATDIREAVQLLKEEFKKFEPKELLFENSSIIIDQIFGGDLI